MKKIFLILLLFVSLVAYSQETIKLMFYNLLNFNNYTSYCTSENNSHENKAGYLSTIVSNQQPDILAVCEVGTNVSASYTLNYILGNSLNVGGETKWLAASPTGSYLINGLFYDKNKFQLILNCPNHQFHPKLPNDYLLLISYQQLFLYFDHLSCRW